MLGAREPPVTEMVEETPFEFMQIGLKSFQLGDTMSPMGPFVYKNCCFPSGTIILNPKTFLLI